MTNLVNLNTAEPEELTTLSGVGPAMADRIVNARPFTILNDLLQVRGIGPALLERLEPLVTIVDPVLEDEVILLAAETVTSPEGDEAQLDPEVSQEPEVETIDLDEADLPPDGLESDSGIGSDEEIIPTEKAIIKVETEPDKKEKSDPRPVTRAQALLMSAGCSFVAFIFAFLLSMGVIGAINGGLRFAKPDLGAKFNNQIDVLNEQIDNLDDDIDNLRGRIDSFEAIGGQVADLEAATADLAAKSEELSANMELTTELITEMNTQMETVTRSSAKFQVFLEGLGDLLTDLTTPLEETP
jgi:competence ComEA-like helix-hairpin-helix protein